jgi:L-ascorbate metabolism protein UlaG (beta-lactamase superfamily)
MASLEATLTLIGGPTVLIEFSGLRLLTDPTFDEPGTYEAAGSVLEKRKGPAFSIDALGVIDAVLLSHDQHFDNFDRTGRKVLLQARNTFTTRTARNDSVARWQVFRLGKPPASRDQADSRST